jgi:hypothetical protein
MAAEMLCAYYAKGYRSRKLFDGLRISKDPSFKKHLNKYNVVFLTITTFLSLTHDVPELISKVKSDIEEALIVEFGKDIPNGDIYKALDFAYAKSKTPFVFIIDEWDCIFRERKSDTDGQRAYLDFISMLLNEREYVQLAYMTGILPTDLDMFTEHSMANPAELEEFIGFTEGEVHSLCERFGRSFEDTQELYDGYSFPNEKHVYNPLSVARAMKYGQFINYWNATETFMALKIYTDLKFDGLQDAILDLIAQGSKKISMNRARNDMSTFASADDVLSLLVHLGYLRYDSASGEVSIPNKEILDEFKNSVEVSGWPGVAEALAKSGIRKAPNL